MTGTRTFDLPDITSGMALHAAPLPMPASRLTAAGAGAHAFAAAGRWPPARQQQFLAARALAKEALHSLALAGELGRDDAGRPLWPAGVVGSLAHSATQAIAAVADARHWLALGVDVEDDEPLPREARAIAISEAEQALLLAGFGDAAPAHERLLFCAKECIHKALNPLHGAWLEFDEVEVRCTPQGRWQARPLSAAARAAFPLPVLEGRWWRADGALWALLALRRA